MSASSAIGRASTLNQYSDYSPSGHARLRASLRQQGKLDVLFLFSRFPTVSQWATVMTHHNKSQSVIGAQPPAKTTAKTGATTAGGGEPGDPPRRTSGPAGPSFFSAVQRVLLLFAFPCGPLPAVGPGVPWMAYGLSSA